VAAGRVRGWSWEDAGRVHAGSAHRRAHCGAAVVIDLSPAKATLPCDASHQLPSQRRAHANHLLISAFWSCSAAEQCAMCVHKQTMELACIALIGNN
jgi:hypothetical protein